VTPDGRIVGEHKPAAGGDLRALGLSGTNNYNHFWYSRLAYGEGKSVWGFADRCISAGPGAEKKQDGIWLRPGASGLALSGPFAGFYAILPAGRYLVNLQFDRSTKLGNATLEMCSMGGKRVRRVWKSGEYRLDTEGWLRVEFESSSTLKNFGVRLHTKGNSAGKFLELEFVPVQQRNTLIAER
jgi:hypothetical protein